MDGSTHWLGVLASLNVPHIAVYGMELLVKQLTNDSLSMVSTALNKQAGLSVRCPGQYSSGQARGQRQTVADTHAVFLLRLWFLTDDEQQLVGGGED